MGRIPSLPKKTIFYSPLNECKRGEKFMVLSGSDCIMVLAVLN